MKINIFKKNDRMLSWFEWFFCFAVFVFYFIWAVLQKYNYAPDEYMRYDVTMFLFNNNRLPVGDELLSFWWGFSYAHLPAVLCNQLGYVFMKIASIFTTTEFHLLVAARMVSVFCGTGAVYYTIKISKQLFKSPARWIMIVLIAFMPQYAFLSSYVNNDIVAFFGISMIMYAWVLSIKDNWNFKNGTLLSVGMSVCALAYYNSYAWILFSIFFFIITYFLQNRNDYKGFAKISGFIIIFTLALIGYSFIRHLVIYGDLLGIETSHKYGELYAHESLKPSNRFSLYEQGVSIFDMLFSLQYKWVYVTVKSFIAVFGYMTIDCPNYVYVCILLIFVIGIIGFVVRFVDKIIIKKHKLKPIILVFYICLALSGIVTVLLSIRNSYCTDFQPQGRYCYPAFLPLAFAVTKGFETLLNLLKKLKIRCYAVTAICVAFIFISLYIFNTTFLPSLK